MARVLVYRFEALSKLPAMLEDFLGIRILHIAERNRGAAEHYAEQYEYVKTHLRLPGSFLSHQYGSKMMTHFYSALERRQFYRKWVEATAAVSDLAAGAAQAQ